ncbi:hypothetical protein ACXWO0_10925, partial [Streptococcus pyogenes]
PTIQRYERVPCLHRHLDNSKAGWRIQPDGLVEVFWDIDCGSTDASLKAAKLRLQEITSLSNVQLLELFNAPIRVVVLPDG